MLMSAISVMAPLGPAIGGPLAGAFGVRLLFVVGGVGCILMMLFRQEFQTRLSASGKRYAKKHQRKG